MKKPSAWPWTTFSSVLDRVFRRKASRRTDQRTVLKLERLEDRNLLSADVLDSVLALQPDFADGLENVFRFDSHRRSRHDSGIAEADNARDHAAQKDGGGSGSYGGSPSGSSADHGSGGNGGNARQNGDVDDLVRLASMVTPGSVVPVRVVPETSKTPLTPALLDSITRAINSNLPSTPATSEAAQRVRQAIGEMDLSFETNRGQVADPDIDYLARGTNYTVAVGAAGAAIALARPSTVPSPTDILEGGAAAPIFDVVRFNLVGANADVQGRTLDPQSAKINYFVGDESANWRSDVSTVGKVRYDGIYSGISVEYYGNGGSLEYDFIVAAKADPNLIRLEFEGADRLSLDADGNLVIEAGGSRMVQQAPIAYQEINGQRKIVESHYVIENGEVHFALGQYDRSRELRIDPIWQYSTYHGGPGTDYNFDVQVDATGAAYVVGYTTSLGNGPWTLLPGSQQGSWDIFASKFTPDGSSRVWSVYAGGSGNDYGLGLALASDNSVYITGATYSSNLPTLNALQSTRSGVLDAYLLHISANGSSLLDGTYLGMSGNEFGRRVVVDSQDRAVVVGQTSSSDFYSVNPVQGTFGGDLDAFVSRFVVSGSSAMTLDFSSFIGDEGSDAGFGVAVNSKDHIYLTGLAAAGLATTSGAYQGAAAGGQDSFIAAIEAGDAPAAYLYLTYLGGEALDQGLGIALDDSDRAYVTGLTVSEELQTKNAFQPYYGGGLMDAYTARLSSDGADVDYLTYLGGTLDDIGYDIAVFSNSAYITGLTASSNFPVEQALQARLAGGTDAFLTKLTENGRIAFSTLQGGAQPFAIEDPPIAPDDAGLGVAVDALGNAYFAGYTASFDMLPDLEGTPAQGQLAGSFDGFVTKIGGLTVVTVETTIPDAVEPTQTPGRFTVRRRGDTSTALTVNYRVDGSATPGEDYSALSGTVIIPIGQETATIDVTPLLDNVIEPNELVIVSLDQDNDYILGQPASATVTIVDQTVSIIALNDGAEAGPVDGKFRVSRTGATNAPLQVFYMVSGTALPTVDYVPLPETITIAAGQSFVDLPVHPLSDGITEDFETVDVKLFNDPSYRINPAFSNATVEIADDDGSSSWAVHALVPTWDPLTGMGQEQTGNLQTRHNLDLDLTPGMGQAGNPQLVYNSDFVDVRPIVQANVQTDVNVALPPSITAQLTWDGNVVATTTILTTGKSPGQLLTLALQVPFVVSGVGRHLWSIQLTMNYPAPIVRVVNGSTFVVNNEDSSAGAGWSWSMTDRLYDIAASGGQPAGKLRVYGTGSWRFYADNGSGGFTSEPGDNGTLSAVSGGFKYQTPDGTQWLFNSAGMQTAWNSSDLLESLQFGYIDADSDGQVDDISSMTAIDGSTTTFGYSSGLLSLVTAPTRSYNIAHSANRNLTTIGTAGVGPSTYVYDNATLPHHLTREQIGKYFSTYDYQYTALSQTNVGGRIAQTHRPIAIQGLNGLEDGTLYSVTEDAAQQRNFWQLDERGRPLGHFDPSGDWQNWFRGADTYVAAYLDPKWNLTEYVRDADGDVLSEILPDASHRDSTYTTGPLKRLDTYTDENGNVTDHNYDSLGHRISTTNALFQSSFFTWNAAGLLETVVDALGRTTKMFYDSNRRAISSTQAFGTSLAATTMTSYTGGNVFEVKDALNRITRYGYDAAQRNNSIITAFGTADQKSESWTLDDGGQIVTWIDANQHQGKNVYESTGQVKLMISALESAARETWANLYDTAGRLVSSVDPWRDTTAYAHDILQRQLTTITGWGTSVAQTIITGEDSTGNEIYETEAHGDIDRNEYDSRGRLIKDVQAAGTSVAEITHFQYDLASNPIFITDALGRITRQQFDALNRSTFVTEAFGTSIARTRGTEYDAVGNISAIIDWRGVRMENLFDALNHMTQTKEAVGTSVERHRFFTFDLMGNLLFMTDERGVTTQHQYDFRDRLIRTIESLGTSNQREQSWVYDDNNNIIESVDARGMITVNLYNGQDQLIQVIEASGQSEQRIRYIYRDAGGLIIGETDWRGFQTDYLRDQQGRIVQQTDPLGRKTFTSYDKEGNVKFTQDAAGFRTHYTYDARDRLTHEIAINGAITITGYDLVGNRTSVKDPLNHTTTFTIDALNRTSHVIDARGGDTEMQYDANSNVTGLIDSVGNFTHFEFDPLNRKTRMIDPTGEDVTFEYGDPVLMTASVDRLGRRREYNYDSLRRLIGEVWKQGGLTINSLAYTYDPNDNMLSASDTNGAYVMTYDRLDRKLTESQPFSVSLAMGYDANGNRTTLTDSLGGVTTSIYNDVNNLTRRTFGGSGQTPLRFDWTHTVRDQVASATRYSNLAGTVLVGTSTFGYDNVMRMTSLVHRNSSNTPIGSYTWGYDLADRVTSETFNAVNKTFGYDDTNQLTNDNGSALSFDLNGNRTMSGYSTGTANRITSDGSFSYQHDLEGNLIRKASLTNGEVWTFGYDHRNQLIWAELNNEEKGTLISRVENVYDVFGQRIERIEYDGDMNVVSDERFAFDRGNAWLDLNGSNQGVTRRLYGDNLDDVLSRITISSGAAAFYLTDRQGNVRQITNVSGAVQDTLDFTGFGVIASESNPSFGDRFKFAGGDYDGTLDATLFGQRFYFSSIGRWSSEDPSGLDAGYNLYAYCANSPTNHTDPTGLDWADWVVSWFPDSVNEAIGGRRDDDVVVVVIDP